MSITMNTSCTLAFPKGTPETLITEALESFPLFHRLLESNRPVLELDVIDHLLDLKEKLGNKVFSKLLKSRYPLATKEITHKLGMAELKRNLDRTGLLNPTTLDSLVQIGTEGCAALAKGSEQLAATLINQISEVAGVTISTLRALVQREKKGFNPFPTSEEMALYQPTTLVTITKTGLLKNWVAEVIDSPDILGRVQVRLVKTNRKKTLFWWEIELHQLSTPDVNQEVPPACLSQIIKQFVLLDNDGKYGPLSENDVETVQEYVERCAKRDASEDTGILTIRWKHLLKAIEQYNLVPVESVLQIQEATPPAPPAPINDKLIKEIASARKMLVTLQREIDVCVQWETRELLTQKHLHTRLRLDKALNVLCGQTLLSGPVDDVIGPVDMEPASEIITKLESERDSLLNEINSLKNKLETNSNTNPSTFEYQFVPVTKLEELKAGDCIRITSPKHDLKFGDVVVEVTEFGEVKTQWFGALDKYDFQFGWGFEKVINPLDYLTILPPAKPISEEWKQLDGPLYEILEMVMARGGDARLETIKGCKIYQHPTPENNWYRFLSPTGQKIVKPSIDGEWVKEQSTSD